MKVLFVINEDKIGGAEKVTFDLAAQFSENGHHTGLFFLKKSSSDFFSSNSRLHQFYGSRKFFLDPLGIYRLIRLIRSYDIVHINLFPSMYLIVVLKFFTKAKFVYTEHSTFNRRRSIKILNFIERFVYSLYDAVVCINSQVKVNLVKHIGDYKNLIVIENGVDVDYIRKLKSSNFLISSLNFNNNDFIICQVSSFIEPKDQMTIVKGILLLPEFCKLILIGDGVKRQEVESFVLLNKLENRVIFMGVRSDAISIMKSCDLLVLSSKYEGLSIFCLEGFACGIPIIGTNVPGLNDLLHPEALFEFQSPQSFSDQVNRLITKDKLYDNLRDFGLFRSETYSIKTKMFEFLNLYKHIYK